MILTKSKIILWHLANNKRRKKPKKLNLAARKIVNSFMKINEEAKNSLNSIYLWRFGRAIKLILIVICNDVPYVCFMAT